MTDLNGSTVAFLLTQGFEDSELTSPQQAVTDAGARAVLISPDRDALVGKKGTEVDPDLHVSEASAADYDALVLPGGVVNGDKLRMDDAAVALTRTFFEQDKPVAVICHGGWILTDADVLQGRTVTSYPSLKTDLRNAGATWVDEEVVVDGTLISSRTPDDLPAFNEALLQAVAQRRGSNSQH